MSLLIMYILLHMILKCINRSPFIASNILLEYDEMMKIKYVYGTPFAKYVNEKMAALYAYESSVSEADIIMHFIGGLPQTLQSAVKRRKASTALRTTTIFIE